MPRSKNKTIGIVLGIFALVIVTTAASRSALLIQELVKLQQQ